MKNTSIVFSTIGLIAFIGLFVLLYGQHAGQQRGQLPPESPPAFLATNIPAEVQESEAISFYTKLNNQFFYLEGDEEHVYYYASAKGGKLDNPERVPLNIALVLDKSGSMSGQNKLGFVKEAAQLVLKKLSAEDKISIVAYDSYVSVLGSNKGSGGHDSQIAKLQNEVGMLHPGSSTFLSGGMERGYKEVESSYSDKNVNRVLLLSDGLANSGVIGMNELQKMVADHYDQEGIAISTFGVGADFNEDMMTSLAEHGRGNYYFIDRSSEIPGIFEEELNGLLSVIAQKVQLEVNFASEYLEVEKVYGYKYLVEDNEVVIDFNDVFADEEKAVLIKFKVKKDIDQALNFKATLAYENVLNSNKPESMQVTTHLSPTNDKAQWLASEDEEVLRNITIFRSNEMMEMAAKEFDNGNYDMARNYLESNELYLEGQFQKVTPTEEMLFNRSSNTIYCNKVKNARNMSEHEQKMMQKSSKEYIYRSNKKKE